MKRSIVKVCCSRPFDLNCRVRSNISQHRVTQSLLSLSFFSAVLLSFLIWATHLCTSETARFGDMVYRCQQDNRQLSARYHPVTGRMVFLLHICEKWISHWDFLTCWIYIRLTYIGACSIVLSGSWVLEHDGIFSYSFCNWLFSFVLLGYSRSSLKGYISDSKINFNSTYKMLHMSCRQADEAIP